MCSKERGGGLDERVWREEGEGRNVGPGSVSQ